MKSFPILLNLLNGLVLFLFFSVNGIYGYSFLLPRTSIIHYNAVRNPHIRLYSQNVKGVGNKKGQRKLSPEMERVLSSYEPVIGIEVHCQLNSNTKAYCNCSTKYNPNVPNTSICPVCLGEPGSLPTPNFKVVEFATKASIALNCKVSNIIKFDRKNYFYPDTPKNYQITQYDLPIGEHGYLNLPSGKRIGITRLHMEEDSAKMIHNGSGGLSGSSNSLIDFNRAGVPLAEIVSEPDMRTADEAADYGRELQKILRTVGVSDGNMAEGSLRLDINVSLRPRGATHLNNKVEIKNINSFRSIQDSVEFECIRQAALYDNNSTVASETRLWDEKDLQTKFMRSKEGAADYRFFPEPDIPPMTLSAETVTAWSREIGELPSAKRERYQSEFGFDSEMARVLTDDLEVSAYLDETVRGGASPVEAYKWITGDIAGLLKAGIGKTITTVATMKLRPAGLVNLIQLLEQGKITTRSAKDILPELLESWGGLPEDLIRSRDLFALSDVTVIEALVKDVMIANPDKLKDYKGGKTKLLGFFVGQAMTASKGRAVPELLQQVVERMLASA